MHSPSVKDQALALFAAGMSDGAVARQIGIPRTTIRDWRSQLRSPASSGTCPRCWRASRLGVFSDADYALLLGAYLGDGCISKAARTFSLRITLDTKYPHNIDEIEESMSRVLRGNRVGRVIRPRGTAVDLLVYSTHLACLFPQAGGGKKHERDVSLEPWQQRFVEQEPWSLLRGLLWTDGCRFINRTGPHVYASWDFTNESSHIRDLFAETCDRVGVEYRRYSRHFRVYRRGAVHLIDEHAGRKC